MKFLSGYCHELALEIIRMHISVSKSLNFFSFSYSESCVREEKKQPAIVLSKNEGRKKENEKRRID